MLTDITSVSGCKYISFFNICKQKIKTYINFFIIFQMSFPKTIAIRPISITKPIICPFSNTFSLGGRPEIISYNKNITCPPSNAGIGKILRKANQTENIAIKDQIKVQSHCLGIISTIPIGPLTCL